MSIETRQNRQTGRGGVVFLPGPVFLYGTACGMPFFRLATDADRAGAEAVEAASALFMTWPA